MKEPVFTGSCTAMISPFLGNAIDYRRMGEQLERQEKNGTAAVLVAGTTGESATLEIHEVEKLVDFCVQVVAGRMKVLVGVGGNNTAACLKKAESAAKAGADAVLLTAPFYNRTSPQGLVEHFRYVAESSPLPLIVYNVPGRTALPLTLELYEALAEHPNINGVKEASGDFSLIARTIATCGDELHVWSGSDDHTLPMMALGAKGVISVAGNVTPKTVSILCSLCESGDYKAAAALYCRYAALFADLFYETNPIPVKAAMGMLGLDSGELRLPLVPMSEEGRARLRGELEALGFFV